MMATAVCWALRCSSCLRYTKWHCQHGIPLGWMATDGSHCFNLSLLAVCKLSGNFQTATQQILIEKLRWNLLHLSRAQQVSGQPGSVPLSTACQHQHTALSHQQRGLLLTERVSAKSSIKSGPTSVHSFNHLLANLHLEPAKRHRFSAGAAHQLIISTVTATEKSCKKYILRVYIKETQMTRKGKENISTSGLH